MQTLGHIYLFDREGNQTACVQVLYRIAKHNSYLKLRRPSKNMGVHFEGEEISLQQLCNGISVIYTYTPNSYTYRLEQPPIKEEIVCKTL